GSEAPIRTPALQAPASRRRPIQGVLRVRPGHAGAPRSHVLSPERKEGVRDGPHPQTIFPGGVGGLDALQRLRDRRAVWRFPRWTARERERRDGLRREEAMSVAENLAKVRARIANPAVKLIAVSKTVSIEKIREAYDAGQRDFGENYAQELVQKADALQKDIRWHFIGHLQSNKAKMVAPRAFMVHSVDSASLAKELGKRATRELPVLLEVNVAGEASKSGCAPSEVEALLAAIEATPNLKLSGLMTMPPPGDLDLAKRVFDSLRELREKNGGIACLPELSMGMTQDLEIAVAC